MSIFDKNESLLSGKIEKGGRFPPVELRIKPLSGKPTIHLKNFTEYSFQSSILVPVDSFSFSYAAPDDKNIFSDYFQEGDIVQLYADEQELACGIVDQIDVEVGPEFGEKVSIHGRDLMGQLEDQDAVNLDSTMIFGKKMTVQAVFQKLCANTRIVKLRTQNAPADAWLFATEPQQSKLSALTTFLESLNCIAWMDPDGTMVIGKPDMSQSSLGRFIVDRPNRYSNCMGMKASFAASTIPNIMVPVWQGQENVQSRVAPQQRLENAASGPARLLGLGHRLAKTVVVSNPEGDGPQAFGNLNKFLAGGSTQLQAYAKRDMARRNVNEMLVEVKMAGHYDRNGNPFQVDRVYDILYSKALRQNISMYLYGVKYTLNETEGQRTVLSFCKTGTIVADVGAEGVGNTGSFQVNYAVAPSKL